MPETASDAPPALDRRWRRRLVLGCSVFALVAATVLLDPAGVGRVSAAVFSTVCYFTVGVLSLVQRRFYPRRLLHVAGIGGFLMCPVVAQPWVTWHAGPFTFSDVFLLFAYLTFTCWILMLAVVSARARDWETVLDTGASTNGTNLALWIFLVAPWIHHAEEPEHVVLALYPILSFLLVMCAAALALRLRRVPAALGWFLTAGVAWVVSDVAAYGTATGRFTLQLGPVGQVLDLVPPLALVAMMCHPRLQEVLPHVARPTWERTVTGPGARTFVLVAIIVPCILAVVVPDASEVDRVLRTMMTSCVLSMVLGRLAYTMYALMRAERQSRQRAIREPLTGLFNRGALFEALEDRLRTDRAHGVHTSLVFLDCDDFKQVNDTWGHHAGDTLLIDVADRLRSVSRPDEVVARLGGDEFVVLASGPDSTTTDLVDRVRGAFRTPLRITTDRTHPLTPSIGAASAAPGDTCTGDELLGRADAAMYEAKRRGKGRAVFYDEGLGEKTRRRAVVGNRLGPAIERGDLDVVLQPIMGGPGYGRLRGWEALARWDDDELGEVGPEEFVPVAEDLGLVGALGEAVLAQACRRVVDLRITEGDVFVSVNVSPSQLQDSGFVDVVRAALRESGLPPTALRLEVTESVLVEESCTLAGTVHAVRRLGVRICIDDFGTGYASLATLLRWPIDCVKVDRSLVASIAEDPAARRRLAAVMALVRSLEITDIVAEGVETEAQSEVLSELDCPAVQGWLHGRPEAIGVDPRAVESADA